MRAWIKSWMKSWKKVQKRGKKRAWERVQNSELDRESANICRPPPRPRRPPSYPLLTRSSFRGVAKVYLMGTAHFSKESREDVRSVMVLCKLKLNQEKCHLQINSLCCWPAGLFQFQIQMRWGIYKTFKTLIVPPWTVSIDILPRPRRRSYSDNNELKIQWYSFEINEGSFYKLISSDSDQVGQLRRTGLFLKDSLKSCIWDNSDIKKRILNAVNLFGGIQLNTCKVWQKI